MSAGIPDLAQRERALKPGRSFIVQAPAGSGKTELLIQRFLVLLARVERPEEITAITFTRKAAAEMRKRIFEALAWARHVPRPDSQPHKARTWDLARAALLRNDAAGWHLEANTARLRVQTIDALCASLTRQMPVLSRFGAQPRSVEDAGALYRQAARNTLAILEDPHDAAAADVARLLKHLDNHAGQAEGLLAAMLRQRDHWLRKIYAAGDRSVLEAALQAVCEEAIDHVRGMLPASLSAAAPEKDIAAWRDFTASLLTKEGGWRKRHPLYEHLCEDDALCAALKRLQFLPSPRYSDAQWDALESIARLLPRAVAELRLVFAARGETDFVEIAQGALRALEGEDGPTDLLLALDYRLRHLLVDEFQDTSFSQFELLKKLTSGWEEGDGRTLFVVGDPMQSIYRFREAEVGLFLNARRLGIGGIKLEPLTLRANFRSQADVVAWINRAFATILPAREDIIAGAVTYAAADAVHEAHPLAVTTHAFFDNDRAAEAHRVVELARAALTASALAPGQPSTAAILVRSRGHLLDIVPRLKAAGLPVRAVEIEPLQLRPVVQDLLALTDALSHEAERTAWLAVLRAPWCGLTLSDLNVLIDGSDPLELCWTLLGDELRISRLSPDGAYRLNRLRAVLTPWLAQRGRAELREIVEGAWLSLGGPACVEAASDLEDARIFLDYLEAAQDAGAIADRQTFEDGITRLYARPDSAASDRLQVMTIHKAKGLEFDTVIVPGLGAGTANDERKLLLWIERTADLLLAPINPAGSDKDPIYEYIRLLDKEKAEHESGRLLYVAATRAKKTLHLLGDTRLDASGDPVPPPRGALLAKLWPVVREDFVRPDPRARTPPADAAEFATSGAAVDQTLRRLPADWIPPPLASPVSWTAPPDTVRTDENIEFSWAGETARHVGSVVHRWLQRIAEDGFSSWSADRIRALFERFADQLRARGVTDAELPAAAQRVVAALEATLADARGRWLLTSYPESQTEWRVTRAVGNQPRALVVDRTFVDTDGVRWIVDYKTSTHEGADIEDFLDAERERYRRQLETYAALISLTDKRPVRVGLYFPLLGGWREWSPTTIRSSS